MSDAPGVSTASRSPEASRRRLDYLPLEQVLVAARNPKLHDEGGIRSSISRFGYVEPIAMDERTGRLVAGHGRLAQLQHLRRAAGKTGRAKGGPPDGIVVEDGRWYVPVVRGWSSADDAEAEAYLIASNRLSERGGWDEGPLAELLADLEQSDPTLPALAGFADVEIADLLERLAADVEVPVRSGASPHEAPPAPAEAISRPGEVIELGPHRLVVGDCGDPAVLERVMDGARAAAMWTDPPYGVNYVGGGPRRLTIANDDPDGAIVVFARMLEAVEAAGALLPGAAFYVAHPDGELSADFRHLLRQAPWRYAQTLVWIKDALVLSRMDYHGRHEPIAAGEYVPDDAEDELLVEHEAIGYGRYRSARGRGRAAGDKAKAAGWFGGNTATTVFEIARPKSSRLHPTMKPLDLVVQQLRNVTRRGQHVLDPFAGSGTTLLAAHSLGLVAHVVELDPRYADVVAARFQAVTGIVPVVEGRRRRYPDLVEAPDGSPPGEAP